MQALQLLNLQEHIQRTSIGSLPSEVIFLVLTKVGRTSGYRGLSQCARVCKSWSEPSLSLLNRHLEIDIRHLKIISTSGIWKRYRMVSLKFWVMKYEAEISSAMELILRECGPGLTTLVLARRAALVIGGGERIPLRVFDLQSLIDIKSLCLMCDVENETTTSEEVRPSIFLLEALAIHTTPDKIPLLRRIVKRLEEGPASHRFSLSLLSPSNVRLFIPCSPKLVSLLLWSVLLSKIEEESTPLARLLQSAKSLTYFSATLKDGDAPNAAHVIFRRLLTAMETSCLLGLNNSRKAVDCDELLHGD